VIIGPNFEIGAKHCVPCVVFLFYCTALVTTDGER